MDAHLDCHFQMPPISKIWKGVQIVRAKAILLSGVRRNDLTRKEAVPDLVSALQIHLSIKLAQSANKGSTEWSTLQPNRIFNAVLCPYYSQGTTAPAATRRGLMVHVKQTKQPVTGVTRQAITHTPVRSVWVQTPMTTLRLRGRTSTSFRRRNKTRRIEIIQA